MEKIKENFAAAVYLALTAVMYYSMKFVPSGITLAGFEFMYIYLLAIAVILVAAAAFLVNPQIPRAWLLSKYSVQMAVPYFISIFISLIIWVVNLSEPNVMIRGLFYCVYQMISVVFAAATLYLFGERGVLLHFGGLVLANLYAMAAAMASGGAGEFFRQFFELIRSNAMVTGEMMKQMEVLGFTYTFGMYIVYFIFYRKSHGIRDWAVAAASVFFFLLGYKRSAGLALLAAVLVGLIFRRLKENQAKAAIRLFGYLLVAVGFFYIWMVKTGLLEEITAAFGIETSGRNVMFEGLDPYYRFSPAFLGSGLGYVTKGLQTGEIVIGIDVTDVHNDFLRQFIEMGFWGYLLWLFSMFVWRIRFFANRSAKIGVMAFMIAVYCFFTYYTENTYNLFFANTGMALFMMCREFDKQEEEEKRILDQL